MQRVLTSRRAERRAAGLTELVDELLAAHADTIALAEPLQAAPRWDAHLAYLRDLQRVGKELLAANGD